jgi:aldehyde dehydrogenase
LAADIPLAIDHFRYSSVIRAEESSITELDASTVSIALSEPLGVSSNNTLELSYINGSLEIAPALAAKIL